MRQPQKLKRRKLWYKKKNLLEILWMKRSIKIEILNKNIDLIIQTSRSNIGIYGCVGYGGEA